MESSERTLLAGCQAHTVTSEREQQILQNRMGPDVYTLPNGVDIDFYGTVGSSRSSPPSLLFVGSMDYHANIDAVEWFVRETWPLLRKLRPDLRFTVVGRNPPSSIRALAADGIEITGTVDDVRPYYAQASAVVVPLRVGGGTRLKILEAMAARVPVVSTRLGAEGLHTMDQKDILLADAPGEIAAAVSLLMEDSVLSSALVEQGRQLVTRSYGWSHLGETLFQVHQDAIRRQQR